MRLSLGISVGEIVIFDLPPCLEQIKCNHSSVNRSFRRWFQFLVFLRGPSYLHDNPTRYTGKRKKDPREPHVKKKRRAFMLDESRARWGRHRSLLELVLLLA